MVVKAVFTWPRLAARRSRSAMSGLTARRSAFPIHDRIFRSFSAPTPISARRTSLLATTRGAVRPFTCSSDAVSDEAPPTSDTAADCQILHLLEQQRRL